MNLEEYRNRESEKLRVSQLMSLIPHNRAKALDIGARDGFLSMQLAEYFDNVTAIDLIKPNIEHERIETKVGDITSLEFSDDSFDLVLCAEVLEHIPTKLISKACNELERVTKEYLIIGVPYNQDLRFGRTTCYSCNKTNPPWGHVNKFDLSTLEKLFPNMIVEKSEYIGTSKSKTNFISTFLMDLAGNPYGTYNQEELCIHCGKKLTSPNPRNLIQKIFTKIAVYINTIQKPFIIKQANWVHVLLKKTINPISNPSQ